MHFLFGSCNSVEVIQSTYIFELCTYQSVLSLTPSTMADGTRLKTLYDNMKSLQGRLDDYQQNSDERHEQTTKHLEALNIKLVKTLLLLADTLSHKPS